MARFVTHPHLQHVNNQPQEAPKKNHVISIQADHSGCGHWRCLWPAAALNGYTQIYVSTMSRLITSDMFYSDCMSLKIQRQVTPNQLNIVRYLKQQGNRFKFPVIYEIDDVIFREDLPMWNAFRVNFEADEIRQSSEAIMKICDEITVTTPYLKEYYKAKTGNPNVTVIPNFMPRSWIGNFYNKGRVWKLYDDNKKQPRILYPGAPAHIDLRNAADKDDFSHVSKAIIDSRYEFKWVFFGSLPNELKQYADKGEMEFHPWVSILDFPKKIHDLEVNAIIAPLADCVFNRGKSDIKHIEGAAFGLPVICQDLVTYKDAQFKFNTGDEMIEQLRQVLKDGKFYKSLMEPTRQIAEGRFLENPDNLKCYVELHSLPYGSPLRSSLARYN